jgi:SAM-dependent methyltransferase
MIVDYDFLAQEYARHRLVHPQVLASLIETGQLDSASQALDVGCGTGNYTLALAEAVGCSCWGIEPSQQMLAQARERASSIHFKLGWAEHLDYPAESFDMVFSVDVIHHVSDRPAYFREAYRVLRKSGRLCTVTDSESIIRQRQPLSLYFPETVEVDLQRYPRISDLRKMVAEAGFTSSHETFAEFAYPLTDIHSYRDKAFSCLHLISPQAFERGIRRMEADLRDGPIAAVSRYLLLWGVK